MTLVSRLLAKPLVGPARALRHYNRLAARGDLIAGLTVAVVAVPQSMAYAKIAGVPYEYGLYTAIIQGLIGSLFNSNPLLAVGPINTQSLLVASVATRLWSPGSILTYVDLVIALTLLKGMIQLGLAAMRIGHLARYISRAVLIGFTAGAGVLIAAQQLDAFLGFTTKSAAHHLPGILGVGQRVLPALSHTDWRSVVIGITALVIVLACRSLSPLWPGPLLAVVCGAVIVAAAGWQHAGGVLVIPPLPRGLPAPAWPRLGAAMTWDTAEQVVVGALALSLLGLMEAYSIGKAIADKTGQKIDANHELFSQGLTNLLSSFFRCIPGSGSFSRSALNQYAGAQTFLSGVYCALLVAAIFLLFGGLAVYVPLASLAAVLFVIAYGLIDFAAIRRIARTSRADTIVIACTFLATIFLPLKYAIYAGIAINLAFVLRQISRLQLVEMIAPRGLRGAGEGSTLIERPLRDRRGQEAVVFLQVEGNLFFGVADEMGERLSALASGASGGAGGSGGVRVVVLRLKRTHSVDSTALDVLQTFAQRMQTRGGHVILCGVRPDMLRTLEGYGLVDLIGRQNVFEAGLGNFASSKRALARAKTLVGSSIDVTGLDLEDEPEGWGYAI